MAEINYHGPVVAFDLDDTLFRERDFCRSGFRYLCNPDLYKVVDSPDYPTKEQLEPLVREMDAELKERRNPFIPFEKAFSPIAAKAGIDWDLLSHIAAYRAHIPTSLKLDVEIKETLETLAAKGVRMAIITDGRSVTQRHKIEALGLDSFVAPEMILISEESGFEKLESKEMFASVVRFFPEASTFFYVGNNPRKDFYFPNIMGWTTIQVPPHPDDVHPDVAPPSEFHAPALHIDNFKELLNFIPL